MLFCINFTRWKQNHIKAFLKSEGSVLFVSSADDAVKQGFESESQLISWASKDQAQVQQLVETFDISPWYVEDGFIRSAGLGTDLTAPASLVLDKTGIYYDPNSPSDLEVILQGKSFTNDELNRAKKLKYSLLDNELSKYNLGLAFNKSHLKAKDGQTIILIPGQVEGDASIKKGCVNVKTNADLIKSVRQNKPDAYLIYKPHPDVVSGNRKGMVDDATLQTHCDLVLLDVSITDCLAVIDEVHTMTSLVGFEGLLRELKVVCYGLPFYSNWGLTDDQHQLSRRSRKLKLDELVAGTLIDYPLYINWQTGDFTTPEFIVKQLKEQIEKQGGKQSNQISWFNRVLRKINNFVRAIG
ncbi:MAG: capsule biosynthesis protein [Cocleimonas sp.]